jgi:CRISPR-associated protein Cmr4
MTTQYQPLFLLCETPMHAGSGSDLGLIDLPVQRERHTQFPKVEGSGLKGSLREAFEKAAQDDKIKLKTIHRYFGFDEDAAKQQGINGEFGENEREYKGCISLTDARLLLFPVKSQCGIFAWVTCKRVYQKFVEEMSMIGSKGDLPISLPKGTGKDSELFITKNGSKGKIGLEEFVFAEMEEKEDITQLGTYLGTALFGNDEIYSDWKGSLKKNIVVLDNDDFTYFVRHCTEVITRTKINNITGTVATSALFNEEYLPQESILYSLIFFEKEFKKDGHKEGIINKFFNDMLPQYFQLGGNATIGKGIVRTNKK